MIITVKPAPSLHGSIVLPSSKSYSIRAFMIAACGGRSVIHNPSDCDDALVALNIAQQLGSKTKHLGKNIWLVNSLTSHPHPSDLNVGESGTVLRFLLPLLALKNFKTKVSGEGTLRSRPNYHLTKVLRERGVLIQGKGPSESVPIVLSGGNFEGGTIRIDGTLSSQFISALLIAAPFLPEGLKIKIKGKKLVSQTYITMTRQILREAGIRISRKGERFYKVQGGQAFQGLKNFIVPADYGLAAFHLAAAALTRSNIVLKGNMADRFVQSDGQILPILRAMGVKFTKTSQSIKIQGPFALRGGEFSLLHSPDLVPIISVLALFAKGRTRLYDIQHVRAKESDRISDLKDELIKVGAKVVEKENELIIDPNSQYKGNVLLDPHRDHRLAMAFCVLGTRLGVRVKDIDCVDKSYPHFLKDFKKLGARLVQG